MSLPDQYSGEQDPWSPTTTFTYDGDGDVLSLTDPDQNTTSWTYDAAGDQTSQSKIAALGYNSNGSIQQQTATDTYYLLPLVLSTCGRGFFPVRWSRGEPGHRPIQFCT